LSSQNVQLFEKFWKSLVPRPKRLLSASNLWTLATAIQNAIWISNVRRVAYGESIAIQINKTKLEQMTRHLLLCALNSGRTALVLDTETGKRYAVALPQPGGALDCAIARVGWMAIQPGYAVYALPDHQVMNRTPLTLAWSIFASADPRYVVARTQRADRSMQTIQLLGVNGVEREISGDFTNVVGDLSDGTLVTYDRLVDWQGEQRPLVAKGKAAGVVSGRMILLANNGGLVLVDATSGETVAGIKFGQNLHSLQPNPSGSALATSVGPICLVATETTLTMYKEFDSTWGSLIWMNDEEFLAGDNPPTMVNIVTGERTPLESARRVAPRANLTNRFQVSELALLAAPSAQAQGRSPSQALAASSSMTMQAIERVGLAGVPMSTGLRLVSTNSNSNEMKAGETQLGGEPSLPTNTEWPRVEGSPMAFLGQVRLDDIAKASPETGLPTSGLLSVFAMIEADGGCPTHEDGVVVRVFPLDDLRRVAFPADLVGELRYGMASVDMEPLVSIPTLYELADDFDEDAVSDLLDALEPEGTDHRLLGYPGSVQGYGAADGWRLLFQLDADPIMDTSFGDGGRLHIWMPTDAPFDVAIAHCTISMDCG
jgi:uncharacterized protein YwqG